jgi:hypothetical protein
MASLFEDTPHRLFMIDDRGRFEKRRPDSKRAYQETLISE